MGAKNWAEEYLDLKPIPEMYYKKAEKLAAKNIFVLTSSGEAICGACNKHIQIKVRHKTECECPECHQKLTAQHVWRMARYIPEFDWVTYSQRINDRTVVIRFIRAYRNAVKEDYSGENFSDIKGTPWCTEELARLYYSEDYAEPGIYQYEYDFTTKSSSWKKDSVGWFKPDTYSIMCRNPQWCMYALQDTRHAIEEFSKLDCFKYYPLENVWDDNKGIYQIHYLMRTARINEKLTKMGLDNLVALNKHEYEMSNYYYEYKGRAWLYGNKPVLETLRLDKRRFAIFKEHPSKLMLKCLQTYKDATLEEITSYKAKYDYSFDSIVGSFMTYAHLAKLVGLKREKLRKYLIKNDIGVYSYETYLNTAKKLGCDITQDCYRLPKNFAKMDKDISQQYQLKLDAIRAKEARDRAMKRVAEIQNIATVDDTIYKIANLIRNCEELRFWTNGSNGLKVIVPESIGELIDEGVRLDNCLNTYAEKIADKKTLIFFIRRLDDPEKEFVAMEYRDNKLSEIRFVHNRAVEDEKILQFAEAFTKQLNEIQIMKKVKRIAA